MRIERLLQRAHRIDRLGAELGLEIFLLALPDAVLAGAGAAHRLGALDQPVHELLAARHLVGIVDVADQRAVEIAVADMADDRRQQIEPLQIVLGLGDAIGEPRDRHADVGRDHAGAGAQRLHRPISVVPRLPEFCAVLGPGGPGEFAAAAFRGDLLKFFDCSATSFSLPWNSSSSSGVSGSVNFE